jgi:predicted RNase H-like HicB family nuclease
MTAHYHIDVFWRAEDESWVANVPDLPGCSAHGDTPEEAIREVQVAMELWLETARDAGDPIPVASYRSEVSTFAKAA